MLQVAITNDPEANSVTLTFELLVRQLNWVSHEEARGSGFKHDQRGLPASGGVIVGV